MLRSKVNVSVTNSSVQNSSKCYCHQNNKSKPQKVEVCLWDANYSIEWQSGMTMTICTAFNNVKSMGCQHFMTWTHGFMHNIWYNVSRVQRVHWKGALRNEAGEISLSHRWALADEVRFLKLTGSSEVVVLRFKTLVFWYFYCCSNKRKMAQKQIKKQQQPYKWWYLKRRHRSWVELLCQHLQPVKAQILVNVNDNRNLLRSLKEPNK